MSVEGEDMQTIKIKVCPYVNEYDRCCRFPKGGFDDAKEPCLSCEIYPEHCKRETVELVKINHPED